MKKQSRYRAAAIVPQRFTYEVATIGSGMHTHAMVKTLAVCGQVAQDCSLHYTLHAVSCRRCQQRLADHPHTYVRSIPPPPAVVDENLRVILLLLEELGGSTTLLAEPTLEALTLQITALEPLLSTHVMWCHRPLNIRVVKIDKDGFTCYKKQFISISWICSQEMSHIWEEIESDETEYA